MKPFTARTLHWSPHLVKGTLLFFVLLAFASGWAWLATFRFEPTATVAPRSVRLLQPGERAQDFPGEAVIGVAAQRVDWQRAPFDTVLGNTPDLSSTGFTQTTPGIWQRPASWQLADTYNDWQVSFDSPQPQNCCRRRDPNGACLCPQGPKVGVTLQQGERGLFGAVGVEPFRVGKLTITALAPEQPLTAQFQSEGAQVWLERGGEKVACTTPCELHVPKTVGPLVVGVDAAPAGVIAFVQAVKP